MQWCRLYSEIVDDDKLSWVADTSQTRRVVVLGVWAGLLALANRSDPRGCVALSAGIAYSPAMLAHKLDCDPAELGRILDAMIYVGILGASAGGFPYNVVNFNKRNFESDDSATRVQRHREKERAVTVTTPDRYCNAPEQSRTEQNRTEAEQTPATVPAAATIPTTATIDQADYARVIRAYESNLGIVSQFAGEDLQQALLEYPAEWIEDAIRQAVRAGVRKWNYCLAILARWKTDGRAARASPGKAAPEPPPKSPWSVIGATKEDFLRDFGPQAPEIVAHWEAQHAAV